MSITPLKAAANVVPGPWDARFSEPFTRKPHACPHDTSYYAKCMLGGVLSCGLTHTAVVPLDVTKCRMQVFPTKYQGLRAGLRAIMTEEGASGLVLGWVPTLIGYSLQGMFKFGLYEVFKDFYGNLAGEEVMSKSKGPVWLVASASAEFFADIALCPMEMVKVRVQTSPYGTWPTSFRAATAQMHAMKDETRFPVSLLFLQLLDDSLFLSCQLGSLRPLWSRQIPYTMAKFFFFEKIVQLFYDNIFTAPKDSYLKSTQLGITFASGYIAGVVCALVSQPADSLVSQMGKPDHKGKRWEMY